MSQNSKLSDAELRRKLTSHGYSVGPVTNTTRKSLTKKLEQLEAKGVEEKQKPVASRLTAFSSGEEDEHEVSSVKTSRSRKSLVSSRRKSSNVPLVAKEENNDPWIPNSSKTNATRERVLSKTANVVTPSAELRKSKTFNTDDKKYSDTTTELRKSATFYTSSLKPDLYLPKASNSSFSRTELRKSSTFSSDYTPKISSPIFTTQRIPQKTTYEFSDDEIQYESRKPSYISLRSLKDLSRYSQEKQQPSKVSTYFGKLYNETSKLLQGIKGWFISEDIEEDNELKADPYSARASLSNFRASYKRNEDKESSSWSLLQLPTASKVLIFTALFFFMLLAVFYMNLNNTNKFQVGLKDNRYPICEKEMPADPCIPKNYLKTLPNMLNQLYPILEYQALNDYCEGSENNGIVTLETLKEYFPHLDDVKLQKYIMYMKISVFYNQHWNIAIKDREKPELDFRNKRALDQLLNSSDAGFSLAKAENPVVCYLKSNLLMIMSSVLYIFAGFLAGAAVLYGGYWYINYKKQFKKQVYNMVREIMDLLVDHHESSGNPASSFLPIDHVRDQLILPEERKSTAVVWKAAVQFIEENESRVRTEVRTVNGEECQVWCLLPTTLSPKILKKRKGKVTEEESTEENEVDHSDKEEQLSRRSFTRREGSYVDREPISSRRDGSFYYEEPVAHSNVTLRKADYRFKEPLSDSPFRKRDLSYPDGEPRDSRRITRREGSYGEGDSAPYGHFTRSASHRLH